MTDHGISIDQSGFPLPPDGRPYPAERDWLAATFDDAWRFVSACVITAVDPCEVAQAVNLVAVATRGFDPRPLDVIARHQQVLIKMEFGDAGRIWRIEAMGSGFITCVQPADTADTIEDAGMPIDLVRFHGLAALASRLPIGGDLPRVASMTEIMHEHREVCALVETAIERSQAYDDLHFFVRPSNTWAGLATALGLAQCVLSDDEAFVADFSRKCRALADRLRPGLRAAWLERVAAGRELAE